MSLRAFRAPGRVNLIGEHTDYTGGLVLPVAIDRAVTIRGRPTGHRIRLRSGQLPGVVDIAADGSEMPPSGWGRYLAAVAAELAEAGRPDVGFEGEVDSDLAHGVGLSSSAALEVAVALALCDAARMSMPPLELAALCQRAERRAVGVPVGIMDQAASILGRAGHALLLDCGTLTHRHIPLPDDLALLVVDSGTRRTLEGSSYAQRRAELERGLEALGGRHPKDVSPLELDGLLASVDAVAARRVHHVVTENARVRAVEDVLTCSTGVDREVLGHLFDAGHRSLRENFEVSTPELDLLVQLAREAGAVAARMTGGGFGGAIVALVDRGQADRVAAEVVDRYATAGPGPRAVAHLTEAADGAARVA